MTTPSSDASQSRRALIAVALGLAASLFFSVTYALNRASALGGGDWLWTAALRYLITLPLLLMLMPFQGGARPVYRSIRSHPWPWLFWGGSGFGVFYLCLSYGAATSPAWLLSGTFALTVLAGMLCAPLLYRDERAKVPPAALTVGTLIVAGVALMQAARAGGSLNAQAWMGAGCVVVSAFVYPLGNRGLMLHLEGSGEPLNATQRVFGMTLASQPVWLAVSAWALHRTGVPPLPQVEMAAGVALSSGVIATILFFEATGRVQDVPAALGAVEAMQAAEVVFATLMGMAFLGEAPPRGWSLVGMATLMVGIVLFSRVAATQPDAAKVLEAERGA